MSIDKDDPRLTQYALGEMPDEEAQAFEAELDAEARAEVEAIRAVAKKIPTVAGPIASLTPEQRWEVLATKPRRFGWIAPAATAAAAVVAIFFLVSWGEPERQRREIARLKEEVAEWKERAEDARNTVSELTARKDSLSTAHIQKVTEQQKMLSALQKDYDRSFFAMQSAELRNEELKRRLADAEVARSRDRAAIEQLANSVTTQTEINRSYQDWVERFTKQNTAAMEDKLKFQKKWELEVRNRVSLEGQVKRATQESLKLSVHLADARKKLRATTFWLDKYRTQFGDITDGPKGAAGTVKNARGEFVMLSVGSQDGVRSGDTYQIRRGGTYVGQVTVTAVYKDQCVGRFDSEFKGPGAPAQKGDAAEPRKN